MRRLKLANLKLPDAVILLDVAPAVSVGRIKSRGKRRQVHETEEKLAKLRQGYLVVCDVVKTQFDIPTQVLDGQAEPDKLRSLPDDIESAIKVFVASLEANLTVKCDVIEARSEVGREGPRHFVGYGGAELFGRIPHYTENRFVKYYKGVFSQFLGDLGPFLIGTSLSAFEKAVKMLVQKRAVWRIWVDDKEVSENLYIAMIVVNGELGPDLPFAKSAPLGSGDFLLFAIRDMGLLKLPGQLKHAWDGSIMEAPERWGFEPYRIGEVVWSMLLLAPHPTSREPSCELQVRYWSGIIPDDLEFDISLTLFTIDDERRKVWIVGLRHARHLPRPQDLPQDQASLEERPGED